MVGKREDPTTLRVLLLSGSVEDMREIDIVLKKAEVMPILRPVRDMASLWQEIEEFSPDLVLLDSTVPNLDCKIVLHEAAGLKKPVPFICLSDAPSDEQAIEMLRAGAVDFVVKDRLGRLAVVVARIRKEAKEREELKRTEEALRKNEGLLARSQRIAKIGSWSWNLKTGEFLWSDEMYRIFGLDRKTFFPSFRGLLKYVHKDDRAMVEDQVDEVRRGKSLFRIKHRIVRPDGTTRHILAEGEVLFSEGESTPGEIIGMVLDITERQEADERSTRLMTAIEQAGEGVAIADRQGRISYCNSAFGELLGLSRTEVVGKSIELLSYTVHDDVFFQAIWSTLKAGNLWSGHISTKNRDGTLNDIEASVTPVKDTSGGIHDFVVVCRSITEQLKLERQLRQAQKSEALGVLAGGIARDFNNILAVMIGYTEIALDEYETGKAVRRSMEQVLKAGMRGRELIRQVLIFSRRRTQEFRLVSIGPTVLEILNLVKSTFPSNIEITHNILDGSPMVLGDPSEIQQAIVNLCTNAMQAMSEKGGVLEIRMTDQYVDASYGSRTGLKEGPYVRLSITDSGTGMEKSAVEHAFDPFFTTRKPGRATGLGLPVALSIVKGHGGTITIESELGKGSTLNMFLPRVEVEPENEEEYSDLSGHGTVLYVDDEEVIVEIAQQTLELLGYRVVAVTDPSVALERFLKEPKEFDIVVTDQIMPGMTGTELAKVLMSLRPDIPIVLTTGFSETIDAVAAKSMGIRAFVMKPLTRAELGETIRRVLEHTEFVEKGPSL